MALVDKAFAARDVHLDQSSRTFAMQPASLNSRQQQLGLLMGRSQPDVLEAARVAALLNGQSSSFNLQPGLGGGGLGLGGAPAGLNLGLGSLQQASQPTPQASQLALPDQLALLSQFPHGLFPQQYGSSERDLQIGGLRNVGKTRSSDSRSSSAYASRHQAAEQRRRTRINERLDLLRKLVPHAERANTACFLEEVIKYIEILKRRTLELETALEAATGKPVAKSLALPGSLPASLPGSSSDLGPDSQVPSPRHPGSASAQPAASGPQLGSSQAAQGAGNGGASSSPLLAPASALPAPQPSQQQQQPASQQQQQQLSPQLPLGQSTAAQLAQLLPSSSSQQQPSSSQQLQQSGSQQLLLPHPGSLLLGGSGGTGGSLSLGGGGGPLSLGGGGSLSLGGGGGGSLSLGGGGSGLGGLNSLSLAHLTAGLQAQHHGHHLPSGLSSSSHHHHHHHHHLSQQLSELQSMHVMQSLQNRGAGGGGERASHAPAFHPINNKAFLHFNEDLFGGIKPELLPSRSLLGAAATTMTLTGTNSSTPSTSLQLTTLQLPTDSTTLAQTLETTRKTLSGSPVSSEESGVPLKKRKVLLL